jgi:vancomycin resistance protein YoaR
MKFPTHFKIPMTIRNVSIIAIGALVLSSTAYAGYLGERMLPHTMIGSVPVGGLTREQASVHLQNAFEHLQDQGVRLAVEGNDEVIGADAIGFDMNIDQALDDAFARGHQGNIMARTADRLASLWSATTIEAPVAFDQAALEDAVARIAVTTGTPKKDLRVQVSGTTVRLATDTAPGRSIDQSIAAQSIRAAVARLDSQLIALSLHDDPPRVAMGSGADAVAAVQRMIARPMTLQYEDIQFFISREKIGSWISNEYVESPDHSAVQLKPALDHALVAQYVTMVAGRLQVAPEPPQISTQDGHITGFVPAKVGRAVEEDELIRQITESVLDRADKNHGPDTIQIPMKTTKMAITGLDAETGIIELIGKAVTPFTGSPKNRISNIKNGVKFLTGHLIQPGEEFSTLQTLGVIDNTTGYLPELVIKGDRTMPDYGGGLCQVSTTLFRAALDAGLPITARRNHSYRVSYYEKDGTGHMIGPGLDATIFQPDLDFKFRNDMATPVLMIGYVIGDKVTFELYGTKDGRTSHIDGPHTLTETAPGPAVYIETTDLAPGVIKQVETPHPGGSAVATYEVKYADGHVAKQEFRSYYRRWPAKFLKGVATLSSPTPPVSP